MIFYFTGIFYFWEGLVLGRITDRYNYLRECELESALKDAQKELSEGKYIEESVEEHIKRITDGI